MITNKTYSMNTPNQIVIQEFIDLLDNFGKQICEDKKGYLNYLTVSASADYVLTDFTLYILAPEIAYEYRVLNVEIVNSSNLKIRFFTLATKQSEHYDIDISTGTILYQNKLSEIQQSKVLKSALQFLIDQILIKREYRSVPITEKIIVGQARVAVLMNDQRINVGWIRIEGDNVVYYTGKGLREMWKPNMNMEEQARAEKLKAKHEEELISEGYIAKSRITDFKDIL